MGRRKKFESNEPSAERAIMVRISEAEHSSLVSMAKEEERTITAVVSRIIRCYANDIDAQSKMAQSLEPDTALRKQLFVRLKGEVANLIEDLTKKEERTIIAVFRRALRIYKEKEHGNENNVKQG